MRRLVLTIALVTVAACSSSTVDTTAAPEGHSGVALNDVHSRLNATTVIEVARPDTVAEVVGAVRRAERDGLAISIAGGRHAMGGQQFAHGALHLDMSGLDRVVALDLERGIATVGAGITWPKLMDDLLRMQDGDPQPWTIIQKQTGADELSIGGAVAANIHGRGLTMQPFVSNVEAFRLVLADGSEVAVSRTENDELFRLAVGGYGLFGVITTVDLRLQRRVKLRREVTVPTTGEIAGLFAQRIAEGHMYGDFQFKTDERAEDFLQTGVFSTYRPVPLDSQIPARQQELSHDNWNDLFVLAHLDKARAFAAYRDYYLGTSGQVYWSDAHQLSYYGDFESVLARAVPSMAPSSLMISEVYVPRTELAAFLEDVAADFRSNGTNLVYGTVRLIRRDTESFLAWARDDYACIVVNLRVDHAPEGLIRAQSQFQRLIDRALARSGSYFLTYHRWARKDQVLAAYPQFVDFLRLKRKYDPQERFQSEWYRHYRQMFADELPAGP